MTPLETLRQTLGDNLVFEPGLTYSRDKSEEGIRKAVEAVSYTHLKGKHELFPIPAEEINLNPMEQNNGY